MRQHRLRRRQHLDVQEGLRTPTTTARSSTSAATATPRPRWTRASSTAASGEDQIAESLCRQLASNGDSIGDEYKWGLASEDPDNPSDSDKFVCYVEPKDGSKLSSKVG